MSADSELQVSAIIPARNEEANIARCVRSVASQQGVREIIVSDDNSQDRTNAILENLRHEIPQLQTIHLESLPAGWMGKTYALAAAAKSAEGEWLLFTDADTEHLPGSLATLVERGKSEQADLLSVSPGQQTPTWWEKAVIPQVYVRLARLYGFEEVSDPRSTVAAANGQYILIRRLTYERVGGHEAVRSAVLEDVELARLVKAAGGRLLFLPGSAWVRTRMYRRFSEMCTGWTKNLYLLYEGRMALMLAHLAEAWLLDLLVPFAYLSLCLLAALGRASAATLFTAAGCLLIVLGRQRSFKASLRSAGFEPALANYVVPGAGLLGLLLLSSIRAYRWTGSVEWKGRKYSAKGQAEP
jgi:chlorobactene glucosyltransferase